MQLADSGGPAFPQLGLGDLRLDWEWCPAWWSQWHASRDRTADQAQDPYDREMMPGEHRLCRVTLDGEEPSACAARLQHLRDRGGIHLAIPQGRATGALIAALATLDRMDAERAIMEARKSHAQRRADGRPGS